MKKKGFTLAELMVSMGIIGVIAAITLPALMQNSQKGQIGPKLTKTVAMFEQANTALLTAKGVDNLLDTTMVQTSANNDDSYANQLTNHLKATITSDTIGTLPPGFSSKNLHATILTNDGSILAIYPGTATTNNGKPAYKQIIGSVIIDINGVRAGTQKAGEDVFAFTWWADGSLKPYGGTGADSGYDWTKSCKENAVPTDSWACAGHIFENNFKVLYK